MKTNLKKAAAILGRKGGLSTRSRRGTLYFRDLGRKGAQSRWILPKDKPICVPAQ